MKKIAVLFDSFKESMTQKETLDVAKKFFSDDEYVRYMPVSDGGEGFLETIAYSNYIDIVSRRAKNLLGELDDIKYGKKLDTAFIESAKIIGLEKVSIKNPKKYSSYYLGEFLKQVTEKNIVISLGGSATVDLGLGMLISLGAKFYNQSGEKFVPKVFELNKISKINFNEPLKFFMSKNITAISDVKNKLLGQKGAVRVFGRQKGLLKEDIDLFESNFCSFANLILKTYDVDISQYNGGGAAGGLGAVFQLLGATQRLGSNYVIDLLNIKSMIDDVDIIITGEGSLDSQSFDGKIVGEIIKYASQKQKEIYAFCGITKDLDIVRTKYKFRDIVISNENLSLKENLINGKTNLYSAFLKNKIFFS